MINEKIAVIIPAAGAGTRMGGNIPKQFIELNGEPILKRTIAVLQNVDIIDEIAVAVPKGYTNTVNNYGFSKVHHIIEGGKDRASSVHLALKSLSSNADTDIVLIHDGVRPFVTTQLVYDIIEAVKNHQAAIACTPVTDTLKKVNSGVIDKTLDRSQLWLAQTPQGFTYSLISAAYELAEENGTLRYVTDDSALIEQQGYPVQIVPSSLKNIKITTAEDLAIGKIFLEAMSCEK